MSDLQLMFFFSNQAYAAKLCVLSEDWKLPSAHFEREAGGGGGADS